MKHRLLHLLLSLPLFTAAQTPQLVADISLNGSGLSQAHTDFVNLGDKAIIVGDNGPQGREPFVVNGSGVIMLKDIAAGEPDSDPDFLVYFDNKVYFVATGPEGRELWSTDGTPAGTKIVHDLVPGPVGSVPRDLFVSASNQLYFTADSKLFLLEAGSSIPVHIPLAAVPDLTPEEITKGVKIVSYKDGIAFAATDLSDSLEIWRTNGTAAGTFRVAALPGDFLGQAYGLMTVKDRLLFVVKNTFSALSSNGFYSCAGAPGSPLEQITAANALPERFLPAGADLAFWVSADGMYSSDGTLAGTVKLTGPLQPYFTEGKLFAYIWHDGKIMFAPEQVMSFNSKIYVSDGTLAGTSLIKTLDQVYLEDFHTYKGWSFFVSGVSGGFNPLIWMSDFTASGTDTLYAFPNAAVYLNSITILGFSGDYMYFQSVMGNLGRELYRIQLPAAVVGTSTPEIPTADYTLVHPTGAPEAVIRSPLEEVLQIRFYSMDGRLLQEESIRSNTGFELPVGIGIGVLQVRGRQGARVFKVR